MTTEGQLTEETLTTLLATVPSITMMTNASSNREESNLNDMQRNNDANFDFEEEEGLVGLSSVRQDIKKLLMLLALHAAS